MRDLYVFEFSYQDENRSYTEFEEYWFKDSGDIIVIEWIVVKNSIYTIAQENYNRENLRDVKAFRDNLTKSGYVQIKASEIKKMGRKIVAHIGKGTFSRNGVFRVDESYIHLTADVDDNRIIVIIVNDENTVKKIESAIKKHF